MRYSPKLLVAEIVQWANRTFPHGTNASRAEHIRREVMELVEAPADPNEMADIAILLIHHAAANGHDFFKIIENKFEVIKQRQWGEPDEFGVVEHID